MTKCIKKMLTQESSCSKMSMDTRQKIAISGKEPPTMVSKFKVNINRLTQFLWAETSKKMAKPKIGASDMMVGFFLLHLNIRCLINYINLTLEHGAIFTLVIFIATTLMISLPLSILYTFLAKYSGHHFIRLWDMVPIFKGLPVTILLYMIFQCMKMFFLLLMLVEMFTMERYWVRCSKLSNCTNDKLCKEYSFDNHKIYGGGAVEHLFKYQSQNILFGRESVRIVILLAFIFILRLVKLSWRLLIGKVAFLLMVIMLLPLNTYNLSSEKFRAYWIMERVNSCGTIIQEIHYVFASVIQDDIPGPLISLGMMNTKSVMLPSKLFIMYLVKILIVIAITFSLPYVMMKQKELYSIEDAKCIMVDGMHYLIAMLPDVLDTYIKFDVYSMFILVLIFWSILYITFIIDVIVYALVETWEYMNRLKYLCHISILLFLGIGTCFTKMSSVSYDRSSYLYGLDFVRMMLIIFSISSLFIYGLRKITADYYFYYKTEFPYTNRVKLMFTISFIVFFVYLTSDRYKYQYLNQYAYTQVFIIGLLVLPLIFGVVCYPFKMRLKFKLILDPLPSWGPVYEERRIARRLVDLDRDYHYRTDDDCSHNCIRKRNMLYTADETK